MTQHGDPKKSILQRIATGLGREQAEYDFKNERTASRFTRDFQNCNVNKLVEHFTEELVKVDGSCIHISQREEIEYKLQEIVYSYGAEKYVISPTPLINNLGIGEMLDNRGMSRISPTDKSEIAKADIGITDARYAIAETGTIVVPSDEMCSRSVSLLPPVHIALLKEDRILTNLHHLFSVLREENSDITNISSCLTFITGPSRTADIELNLTLGVHGPGKLIVFIVR